MINWIEKGESLIEALEAAGFRKRTIDNVIKVFPENQEAAAQAIIDNHDPLPYEKRKKRNELKREAARRANAIYGFIEDDPDRDAASDARAFYNFASDLYTSIKPQAREALSGRLLDFKAVNDAATDAIAAINAINTTAQDVMDYDVVNTPNWP